MSEKKFRLSSETVLQYKIMNNDTDLNENEVVDLLNKLYEENEQLKKEYKIAIDEMITDYKKLEKEIDEQQAIIDRLQRYNDVLHDENLFNTMKMFEFMKEKGVFDEFYERIKKEVFGNE